MKGLKAELVRMSTKDGLELQGLLYEPERKTKKILIHVHAWVGNFYENRFLDYVASGAVSDNIAFLTFNNRGTGIITDMVKTGVQNGEYVRIGGNLEKFEDCIFDMSAAIDFVSKRGYDKVILEGHSLGCQKVAFYNYETKDIRVIGAILLAPVDDIAYVKRLFKNNYEEYLKVAEDMVKSGRGDSLVPETMAYYPLMPARRWLDLSSPKTAHGSVFDYSGEFKEIKGIGCPVLAIFGSIDNYESEPEKKLELLNRANKNIKTKLIAGANHWFGGHEAELAKAIAKWIKSNTK